MGSSAPKPQRGPAERALAWLVTGPLGHLWSAVADITEFSARRLVERNGRRAR